MISLPPQAYDPTLAPCARRMPAGNHTLCSRGLLTTLLPLGKLAAHGPGGARAHGAPVAHRAPAANAERPKLRTHKQRHTRHITPHHTTPRMLARARTDWLASLTVVEHPYAGMRVDLSCLQLAVESSWVRMSRNRSEASQKQPSSPRVPLSIKVRGMQGADGRGASCRVPRAACRVGGRAGRGQLDRAMCAAGRG